MKIVKLELNGFKSFAEKVSFSMHPGITCIVGPNGSGKSNVVDAFRWVLGEQSARTLRGEKMEEIIFSGTSQVKQKGMAEVTLTLSRTGPGNGSNGGNGSGDNGNGGNGNGGGNGKGTVQAGAGVSDADGGDVSEQTIEVSRRLFRLGESEYIINKVKTRLKDVRDLFLDTGLEVKSYSILEQGRIAEILNARPIERRFLIEEAAGVMKYKVRRTEAMGKLEKSRANLERVNDVISEVKRSIASLERQVKKAEKYRAAIADLTDLELRVAWRDYAVLRKAFGSFTGEFEALAARLSVIKGTAAGIEESLEGLNASLGEKMGVYDDLSRRITDHERDRTALEKRMALLGATVDSIAGHLERLDAQAVEYSLERNEGKSLAEELSRQEDELKASITPLEGEIERDRKETEALEKEHASIEDDVREKNRRLFQVSEQISNARNDLSRLQTLLGSLRQKKDSSLSFLRGASESLETRLGEIASLEKAVNEKETRLAFTRERIMVSRRTIGEQEGVIESLRKDVAALREQIASDSSRLKSIEEMSAGHSTALELAASVEVLAPISSVVVVPREFEVAIENSLAHRLKGFIVKDRAALGVAVRFLKEGGWERTSLVAPDMVREASARCSPDAATKKDGITAAASLIQGEGAMMPVLRALLRDFCIVKDFDEAIGHFHEDCGNYNSGNDSDNNRCYATLDGDVIEPSGVVTSGKGSTVLRHLRFIRELREKAGKDAGELKTLTSSLALATTERENLKLDLQELNEEAIDADKEISIHKVNLKKQREDKERLDKKLHYIKLESEETDKEIEHLGASISEKEDLVAALTRQKEDAALFIQGLRDTQSRMRAQLELLRAGSTGKKVDVTRQKERLRSLQNERASLLRKDGLLEEKLSSIDGETAGLIVKRDDAAKELREDELRAGTLQMMSLSLRAQFDELREELDDKKALIKEKEKALHLLKNDQETTKERMSDLEVRLMEHRLRMENIKSMVSNTYGKNLDDIDVVPPTESEEAKIPVLKQKVQDMGPVNLASIEEYGELNTRYDFLSAQQSDIAKSIEELEQAISKINATTKVRLGEAFEQLNGKFQETFKSFFGGGDASLTLTDSANILESGIEITVQPPGKRLQNINLLSGGEKALSALSLIFAGFLIKPTPLCLLDEADAALDESNTRRFAEMLKTISDKTQFIVITHNRTTMEVADYIYGITNEAAGISKVISVELSGVAGKSEALGTET